MAGRHHSAASGSSGASSVAGGGERRRRGRPPSVSNAAASAGYYALNTTNTNAATTTTSSVGTVGGQQQQQQQQQQLQQQQQQQAPPKRLERTTACLPIVYGSVAFYLGKKADEYQTHEWTLYLRGPNGEDLSAVVGRVVFQLHASFAQPVRELSAPPFEVTERGWGEFEAQIRIHWRDETEKSTLVTHGIKLYPPAGATLPGGGAAGGADAAAAAAAVAPPPLTDTETPVVSESYDEVVFTDPTETFFGQLQRLQHVSSAALPAASTAAGAKAAAAAGGGPAAGAAAAAAAAASGAAATGAGGGNGTTATAPVAAAAAVYSQRKHFQQFSDREDFLALCEASEFLQEEIARVKERYLAVDADLAEVDRALRERHESHRKGGGSGSGSGTAAAPAAVTGQSSRSAKAPSRGSGGSGGGGGGGGAPPSKKAKTG